jgi:hypothetical protein
MEPPSEAFQMLLADAITITSSITRMIGRAISLNCQDKTSGLLWVLHGEIESIATYAVLRNGICSGGGTAHLELQPC